MSANRTPPPVDSPQPNFRPGDRVLVQGESRRVSKAPFWVDGRWRVPTSAPDFDQFVDCDQITADLHRGFLPLSPALGFHRPVTTKLARLRARVRPIVERPDGPGRTFDLIFQVLIVLSLVAFLIETEPDLPARARVGLEMFEVFTVLAFSFEYALRLWVAPRPLRFVFSFWGLVDLLAILPLYLGGAVDLRSIRVLRLLRLVRVLRLARYGAAAERLRRAFVLIRAELTLFAVGTSNFQKWDLAPQGVSISAISGRCLCAREQMGRDRRPASVHY